MEPGYTAAPEAQAVLSRGDRRAEVAFLAGFRDANGAATGCSLLQYAQQCGVPESTVRHWVSRAQSSGAPKGFVDFVESPEGLVFLHRIVLAAMFVLTQVIGGGVRAVCIFLELSGLWRVVAAGYGTQQVAVKEMEEAIVAFGVDERAKLAAEMAPRDITITQDETFHEQPCLVAMEPVSNFIFVEEHAPDRRAETWANAVERGLKDIPVKVIQSTSDEGSALLRQTRESGAHHSPDLFHPQQDISRATSLPLQRQEKEAKQAASEATLHLGSLINEAEAYQAQPKGPGRPRDYDKQLQSADEEVKVAEAALAKAKANREEVREAARAISQSYHPFDLVTGATRDAATVQADLQAEFTRITQIAETVGLSARCWELLKKAQRLLPQMVKTIDFVHNLIQEKISALDLPPAVEEVVSGLLVPVCYLEEVIRKAPTAEARSKLRTTITSLRALLESPWSALAGLTPTERDLLHRVARECAQIFQRSSSNVEGRNGVLALHHHLIHALSPRKLQALTVIHNYWTTRVDGTTAAERFFGQRHRDLFEHLLAILPPPKRPAARRAVWH